MPTIREIELEIISEFSLFDDPMDRYEYIIEIGKKMPDLAEQYKTEENIVKGCQSTVWLHSYLREGNIFFEADSNTVITKGIIGLLVRVLSGHKADEIINAELNFIDAIGLRSHLSSQRSNGLNAMIKQMKLYALAFKTKEVSN
jgi:cysteine desulfuration protein SufE